MKTITAYTLIILALLFNSDAFAQDRHMDHTSTYAGQETRAVKSLSESDIEELKAGKGWGLAKPAELNGYPGPIHVLDMADEMNLSDEQKDEIEALYKSMQREAIAKGEAYIQKEKELDKYFQSRELNSGSLMVLLKEVGVARAELRFVHLSAHLQMMDLLTEEQVNHYNELRGYNSSADPCENIPEGHNPEMWKKHNDCN